MMQRRTYLFFKRFFDIVLSVLALIVLSPVFLITAIAIRIEDGGKVIYKQERIGKDEKRFWIYKFRSMVSDADKMRLDMEKKDSDFDITFKPQNDPRVTKVGKVIRRFCIDETPQFVNVLKGEMSIVGPRPLAVYEYERNKARFGNKFDKRYSVQQGMTCYWQIYGRGIDMSYEERMNEDVRYVDEARLGVDARIFFKTMGVVLTNKRATRCENVIV